MAVKSSTLLLVLLLVTLGCAVTSSRAYNPRHFGAACDSGILKRSSFPSGFIFGSASSSYQVVHLGSGGANEGGRGPSIWDTFTHKYPGNIADGSTGDVAVDQYHHYKEDVRIMKEMGFDAYRFSISWSRLLPNGKLSGGVNKQGVQYYKNLIDELVANGIKAFVTIFHWDLPQTLEDEFGGFLSPQIVNYFRDFADLCFREFGDKVKHWITMNEPWSYSNNGYVVGKFPPGRCSKWQPQNCTAGDSGTEPYLVGHNQLLSHAAVVKLYREKYQASQKGLIGITLVTHWFVPFSESRHDRHAAKRALDFMFGWFMDPVINGRYPYTMRHIVRHRLPEFTKAQSEMLKGSYDFIGVNYYAAYYAAHAPPPNARYASYSTDNFANFLPDRDGILIGPKAASDWLHVYPRGLRELLVHIKRKYKNPLIYITENGYDDIDDPKLPLEEALIDNQRVDYYDRHLDYLNIAIKDGVNVKGYFAWSLFDNFEWDLGYTVRFGINYVDYKDGLKRYPKLSACWFQNFLTK